MKFLFTSTKVVQNQNTGTAKEERYLAGHVYDLPPTSVARWLSRKAGTTDATLIAAAEKANGGDDKDPSHGQEKVEIDYSKVVIPNGWTKLSRPDLIALAVQLGAKKNVGVNAAAQLVASELFRRAEPIQLRKQDVNGQSAIVVLQAFPAYTAIHKEILADPKEECLKVDGEKLHLTFMNGDASYIEVVKDENGSCFALENSNFQEPPAAA